MTVRTVQQLANGVSITHEVKGRGGEQIFALWTLQSARSNFPDLDDDLPASTTGVLAHGFDL